MTDTQTTKIRIAHSPDSDDAFMFYGLASGGIGFAMGGAVGISLALRDRPVVAIVGGVFAKFEARYKKNRFVAEMTPHARRYADFQHIPVTVVGDLPDRPSAPVETAAYFALAFIM